jgi:anti-anti-sigma regulatory factor
VSFQAFSDLAKRAYVESAREDFAIPGRKPTVSRIAVLTGLTRKEIQRLADAEAVSDTLAVERYNRAARVVAGWVRDKDFRNENGKPRALPQEGSDLSFAELVRRYSGDIPPRAILDELLQVGTVERDDSGCIRLLAHAYIPRRSESDKLAILGTDVSELIDTIDHNLGEAGARRFQRKVMYDNLPIEAVEKFHELSAARAQALMEYLDSWLSQHDRDANPASEGEGRMRAGIGIYYFEENLDKGKKETPS